jgi:xanthine dehydrogenase accessory factor
MKEVKEILDRVAALGPNEKAILATVVDVRGSGYRLPGARMLILENGETYGMISGGCLESDVLERAKKVLKSGCREVFVYDTTNEENSVFSLNMGCRGVVRILLEAVGSDSALLNNLQRVYDDRNDLTIATLISCHAESGAEVGGRIFYTDEGGMAFDRLSSFLTNSEELRNECTRFHAVGSDYRLAEFMTAESGFEFAFESIGPPIHVLLFGAGADAIPLARTVSNLGWRLTVFDHRPAFVTSERFPEATRLILADREEAIEKPIADDRTVAVVMTHNYERDVRILPALLKSNVGYIAMLGPKRRTEQMLDEIAADGVSLTREQLARIYAPAGLDIGADTPEGIALSIAAEIQSVLKMREGGHLRNRRGSIYDRK